MLQLNLDKAVQAVLKKKAKIVAVQIPEGLKQRALEIASKIEEKTGAVVFTFVNPCYGACDLIDAEAKRVGASLLLHFGHSQFVSKTDIETVYLPLGYELKKGELAVLANEVTKKIGKAKKVALCSTIQYLGHLKVFAELLEKKGLEVFVGKGKGVSTGQVLGCNYSSVKSVERKVEAVVFLGDGLFHVLGISFSSNKPVFTANPMSSEVYELKNEKDLFLRKRYAVIARAMDAKRFGILLSSKRGQLKGKLALKLKQKIEAKGRKAFIFVSDFVKPEYIIGIKVDALVSTACPRIAFDDSSYFKQPLLSPSELSMVFGEKKLENYKIDEFL